jgi:hypothetical protein
MGTAGVAGSTAAAIVGFVSLLATPLLGAVLEEGYHCRHNVTEYGALALLLGSYELPLPPADTVAGLLASSSSLAAVVANMDGVVSQRALDTVWPTLPFINDPAWTVILNGSASSSYRGNHDWYDTFWGFSSVLPSDGCGTTWFTLTTVWDLWGSVPVQYGWSVPTACLDGAAGRSHSASY